MMKDLKLLAAGLAAALVSACDLTVQAGGSDAGSDGGAAAHPPIMVGGFALEPRTMIMAASLVSWPGQPPDGRGLFVALSDNPGLCNAMACQRGPWELPSEGTHLLIRIIGVAPGRYPVGVSPGNVSVDFRRRGADPKSYYGDYAVSGAVTLDSYTEGGLATGSYDLTMDDGAVIQGSFAATYCKGLTLSVQMGGVTCGLSNDTDSCQSACNCEGQSVGTQCMATANGSWSCTCTSPSETTTCSLSAAEVSGVNGNACTSYITCCPMKF
jgi:hypothetical protein